MSYIFQYATLDNKSVMKKINSELNMLAKKKLAIQWHGLTQNCKVNFLKLINFYN